MSLARSATRPAVSTVSSRALRTPGRPGVLSLLHLTGRRFDAPVRFGQIVKYMEKMGLEEGRNWSIRF
jgi:hypothetical protein